MDFLSELIDMASLRPALDMHCLLGGRFNIHHDAAGRGILPFHVLLRGECVIELEGQRRAVLQSGDILLLPAGSAHVIRNRRRAASAELVIDGGLLRQRRADGVAADVDLLCGHFKYDPTASGLLLDALPDMVQVSLSRQHSDARLSALLEVLKEETTRALQGHPQSWLRCRSHFSSWHFGARRPAEPLECPAS